MSYVLRAPGPIRALLLSRPVRLYSTSFEPRPGPPKLPADQQAEFERLQRSAAVSSAFQPAESSEATSDGDIGVEGANPALFRTAKPEFEGDTNPVTGEVGGPKNEPLRWGSQADWSYNGRVTDF